MKSHIDKETEDIKLISIGNTYKFYSATTSILDYHMLTFSNFSDRDYEIVSNVPRYDIEPHGPKDEAEFDDIQQLLCHYFGNVRELYAVYILEKEKDMQVWIIISVDDDDLRDSIYDIQYALLNEHPYLRLDFYVIPLGGRNLRSIVPTNAMRLSIGVNEIAKPS